tara:strand:+ start:33 stop:644 length:612 start_codon:yes stop_codon:yes gene_type:complete
MSSATNISSLPTDPAGGGSVGGNIQITATEQNNVIQNMSPQQQQMPPGNKNEGIELSQSTIAELVSGIQKIAKTRSSELPSRDIPNNESRVAADVEVTANYIPKNDNADYIKDYQNVENIIREQETTVQKQMALEDIYEEFQTPIIAMIIYFLFQLPAFKKYERRLIPGLFGEDFNINTYGIMFNSILIALIIFILRRVVKHA